MSSKMGKKVCVTGGAGFIGSWLVKKLLQKGYVVHATLRNINDSSKVGLLKGLPHAEDRLRLFEADIYDPDAFELAIQGCECVFHVATPKEHKKSEFKDTTEAALSGVKSILGSCIKSGTVSRLIYTATVMSASPLKDDGTGFKDTYDESCWTSLDHSFAYGSANSSAYTTSKTLAEKEVLKYNDKEKFGLDVVTLACSLVIGETLLPHLSETQEAALAQLTGNSLYLKFLRLLQEMLGSVPMSHIDDICEAHIFCMEKPQMNGRFICSQTYPTIAQIAEYYRETYPELKFAQEITEEHKSGIKATSTKLTDSGFEFKYDMKKMLDNNLNSATRLGLLFKT